VTGIAGLAEPDFTYNVRIFLFVACVAKNTDCFGDSVIPKCLDGGRRFADNRRLSLTRTTSRLQLDLAAAMFAEGSGVTTELAGSMRQDACVERRPPSTSFYSIGIGIMP
jgi:hypothetical protein